MSSIFKRRPAHYAFGTGQYSACGIAGLWHRGLNYTRKVEETTCGHCLRWLRSEAGRQATARPVVPA